MSNFKEVDVYMYLEKGLASGKLVPFVAYKYARIIARKGVPGEIITTWTVDRFGNEVKERISKVSINDDTNEIDWVVTKVDDNGKPIIDNNNHLNQWVMSDYSFNYKFMRDSCCDFLYKPKHDLQMFVEVSENILIRQRKEDIRIASGGFINITNLDDICGVSKRDFEDTYKVFDNSRKPIPVYTKK